VDAYKIIAFLEVVSKPQIRFKGPACQRDFASDLFKLKASASVPRIGNGVRHTFWRMSISIRWTIRHKYWRTVGPQSAVGGLKPLLIPDR